ncbi:MAG: metallophosphoesterase [Christensenellaceae bacterium]|nr:metallophosphoesterase [Christensenellaceae bacterium]
MDYVFVGDVHGKIKELKKIVKKYKGKDDVQIVLVGDFLDGDVGSKPYETFLYIRKHKIKSIMGNHEQVWLDVLDGKENIKRFMGGYCRALATIMDFLEYCDNNRLEKIQPRQKYFDLAKYFAKEQNGRLQSGTIIYDETVEAYPYLTPLTSCYYDFLVNRGGIKDYEIEKIAVLFQQIKDYVEDLPYIMQFDGYVLSHAGYIGDDIKDVVKKEGPYVGKWPTPYPTKRWNGLIVVCGHIMAEIPLIYQDGILQAIRLDAPRNTNELRYFDTKEQALHSVKVTNG